MDRELWSRITEIFDAALDRPADARAVFIQNACGNDLELLGHVLHLVEQFERADGFLDEPIVSAVRSLADDDLVAGRYRIESLLGRGGMGEVYAARDEFIDDRIALKTLRPEFAQDREFVRRFGREVRLARKVTHPHVCRVFDLGVHNGRDRQLHFFTMEWLDGETLAARLHRAGPFTEADAYALAAQLAGGLAAAHLAGVIHRDFKSANVMLCGDRAVITDFGLARVALMPGTTSSTVETITAQVAGTVAYMSPEHLAGQTVTEASDIYSLGVVMFEMITGRLPFDDAHIIQSAMQRAAETAPDVRMLAPTMSAACAAVITKCLQRDPARRFPSALTVARRLQRRWRPPLPYWTRRQWSTVALGGAAAAAGVALVPRFLQFSSADVDLPEGAQLLIGTITNSTRDSQFDGLTELFRNQLAQSVRFGLIDSRELHAALTQMGRPADTTDPAAIREAAWRLNAVMSVFGDVSRVGTDYAVHLKIEVRGSQPDNPTSTSLRSFSAADPSGLMRSVREASLWIRGVAGESAASIAAFDRLPSDTTTPSWEALTYFARGQQFYMKNDWEAAILEFDAALREDPQFTLAAMRRADVLMSQERQAAGVAQWRSAIAMLQDRAVTRAEELYGRGMFAFDSGEMDAAERYFRTWAIEYPFEWRAQYFRALPLCLSGHASQALELLQSLRTVVPGYGDLYAYLIAYHLVLGQTRDARALVPILRRLGRPERADLREAFIRFREADCVGCVKMLRTVQRSAYRRGAVDAMLQEGLVLIDAGYPDASAANIEHFLRAGSWVETAAQERSLRLVQGWAEMLTGNRGAAVDHARQALGPDSGALVLALAGTIFARSGAAHHARETLDRAAPFQDVCAYQIAHHRITGELARADGRFDVALAELRRASTLEPAVAHRQYLIEALPAGSAERLELAQKAVQVPWQNLRPPVLHHIGAMAIAVPEVNASAGASNAFARRFAQSSSELASIM